MIDTLHDPIFQFALGIALFLNLGIVGIKLLIAPEAKKEEVVSHKSK